MLCPLVLLLTAALADPVEVLDADGDFLFEISPPVGWSCRAEHYTPDWHRDVFVTLNSASDWDLRLQPSPMRVVRDSTPPSHSSLPVDSLSQRLYPVEGGEYKPEVFVTQVPPGVIYLDVGLMGGGPPPPREFAYGRPGAAPLRPGRSAALQVGSPRWESELGAVYEAHFNSWGPWSVVVVAGKPFDRAELEKAFDSAASVTFRLTPVVFESQAVYSALSELPEDMLPAEGAADAGDRASGFRCEVQVLNSQFLVHFREYDESVESRLLREMSFTVDRDGTVTRMQ